MYLDQIGGYDAAIEALGVKASSDTTLNCKFKRFQERARDGFEASSVVQSLVSERNLPMQRHMYQGYFIGYMNFLVQRCWSTWTTALRYAPAIKRMNSEALSLKLFLIEDGTRFASDDDTFETYEAKFPDNADMATRKRVWDAAIAFYCTLK